VRVPSFNLFHEFMFNWFELSTLRINFNDTTKALKDYGKHIA
jgi:hypothetical protein